MSTQRIQALVIASLLTATATASAQNPGTLVQRGPSGSLPVVPLEVVVVIAKFQGEKRIGSVPYTLAVNANSTAAQLTIGTDVPVPTTAFTPGGDGKSQPLRSYNYRNVGTVISAGAQSTDDGRFELDLSIDESSVGTSGTDTKGEMPDMPIFKSFKTRNKLLLRSGQSRQYTAATDRVSGETVRIEVTLTVVK